MDPISGSIIGITGAMIAVGRAQQKRRLKKAIERTAGPFTPPAVYSHHGNGFATDAECAKGKLFAWSGSKLGFSVESGRQFRYGNPEAHGVIFGPTSCGKSSAIIAPNLMTDSGTARVFMDPKAAELTQIVGKYLAGLGPFFAWAPYGLPGKTPHGVRIARANLLAPILRRDTPRNRRRMMAKALADGIVAEEVGHNAFFLRNARELGTDCILAAIGVSSNPGKLTLPGVLKDVCVDFERFCDVIVSAEHSEWSPIFAGYKSRLGKDRGFDSVVGTLQAEAAFLRDEAIAEAFGADEIPFHQLGAQMMSISSCLPLEMLDQAGKVNRLWASFILGQAINSLRPRKTKIDLWFDEAASFGKLDSIVAGYRTGRAYGVRLWTCFTDVPTMDEVYGQGDAASIRGNSSVQIYFPGKDVGTALHVSRQASVKDVVTRGKSVSYDREGWPTLSESWSQHQREVVTAGEFQDLDPNLHLIWVRGVPGVIKAKHVPYFKQWRYFGKYGKNNLYGG
jgi:type IV secretory pathway TraG/TraD family ATPase VirD4